VKELTAAAPALAIKVHFVEARGMSDLDGAFVAIVKDPPEALLVVEDGVCFSSRGRGLCSSPPITVFRQSTASESL
jgi:hypothetical protein